MRLRRASVLGGRSRLRRYHVHARQRRAVQPPRPLLPGRPGRIRVADNAAERRLRLPRFNGELRRRGFMHGLERLVPAGRGGNGRHGVHDPGGEPQRSVLRWRVPLSRRAVLHSRSRFLQPRHTERKRVPIERRPAQRLLRPALVRRRHWRVLRRAQRWRRHCAVRRRRAVRQREYVHVRKLCHDFVPLRPNDGADLGTE